MAKKEKIPAKKKIEFMMTIASRQAVLKYADHVLVSLDKLNFLQTQQHEK